jgi:predicted transcriptional regulator
MKTAVSIPDELYLRAERLAEMRRTSPEEVLGEALKQYLDRQADVTEAMNHALDSAGAPDTDFVNAAARRILQDTEW